jgi:hypothetical protein
MTISSMWRARHIDKDLKGGATHHDRFAEDTSILYLLDSASD